MYCETSPALETKFVSTCSFIALVLFIQVDSPSVPHVTNTRAIIATTNLPPIPFIHLSLFSLLPFLAIKFSYLCITFRVKSAKEEVNKTFPIRLINV